MSRQRERRRTRAIAGGLLAAAALATAGCGGNSDADTVRSTIREYYTAFANADGTAVCARLSKPAIKQIEARVGAHHCAAAVSTFSRQANVQALKSQLGRAKITDVKVHGTIASALVALGQRTASVALVKEDKWKIASSTAGG